MILVKIWFAGAVLYWLIIALAHLYYLIYDWRWYMHGELPPRSVTREVRRLVKIGRLKEPVEMNVELIKDHEGVVSIAIMRFGEGSILYFYDTIGRIFEKFKRDIWANSLLTLLWPVFIVAFLILTLMDMVIEKRRQAKK